MEVRAVELLPGDVTEFGTVKYVTATRRNIHITVHFEDGTKIRFTNRKNVNILEKNML